MYSSRVNLYTTINPHPKAYTHSSFAVQGCVEIVYVTLQTLIFVMVVYWMCWFQRDAGQSTLLKLFVNAVFASVMCCSSV